jgi:hypothetical protein
VVVVLVVVEVVEVLVVLVEVLVDVVEVLGGIVVVVEDDVDAAEVTPVGMGAVTASSRRSSTSEVSAGAPEDTAALHALVTRSTASPNARRSNMPPDGSAATAQSDITSTRVPGHAEHRALASGP